MELDDLKKTWKENTSNKITNTDIMELIQHKSYGPIAALKKAYRKQIINLVRVPLLLLLLSFIIKGDASKLLGSVLFWTFVAMCIVALANASYNYRIVSKMEGMNARVKDNLEQQINLLDTRLNKMITIEKWLMLIFISAVEFIPYFPGMPDGIHSVNPMIRLGIYGLMLIYQYYIHKWILEKRYGDHIDYLKRLIKEMQ